MSGQEPFDFMELLEKYTVEIPVIQRDYAQGRQDVHTANVRSNLLSDIRNAVLSGESVDLNFIYGKAENGKFIPIDGQQRLTTLFLLHLYAFRADDTKTQFLKRFTYETRISSESFFRMLVENRGEVLDLGMRPSEQIKDAAWFAPGWDQDPTVRSALVMLDAIKDYFSDIEDLGKCLLDKEHDPVKFQFLNIEDLGMEDSLYIKLNARGKPLTEFENFKACLIGRLKAFDSDFSKEFEQLFDGKWTDLFWSEACEKSEDDGFDPERVDRMFYAFFGIFLMNHGMIENDIKWQNSVDYTRFSEELFYSVFYTLNFLSQKSEVYYKEQRVILDALENTTYRDRVLFHAVTIYLYRAQGTAEESSMKSWMRIVKNLAFNSQIDNAGRYRAAIKSIDELSAWWMNLNSYFEGNPVVSFFDREQIEEEKIKAQIISSDSQFAEEIYKAEENPYFSGQIRGALYRARNPDRKYDMKSFVCCWRKIESLFSEKRPIAGNLMRRALLTFGDYTLPVSAAHTLCVDDPDEASHTPGLKRLFSQCGSIVKEFLDAIDAEQEIEPQLQQIIDNAELSGRDWRSCFIRYPSLFKYMNSRHLRIRRLNGEMHIIRNQWANGYNFDLFLAALKEEMDGKNISSEWDDEKGSFVQHRLYIEQKYIVKFYKERFYVEDEKQKPLFISQIDEPVRETVQFFTTIL